MPLLSNDQFLARLGELFEKSKTTGTVYITMKRYAYPLVKRSKANQDARAELESPDTQFPSIMRACIGKHKISTLVEPDQLIAFTDAYASITRSHMDSLKRKDRKERKKKSAAAHSNEPAAA
ncbi:RNA-binding signal recognition particle subunit srp14 [Polyrhizophydium stewartii]|uniref:Signal recognition particle subunit SRP14 n=1 Tax=Polyrhizophydium stewartii TaxID=2732419 RepID=A0ABR4MZP9_9FUNG|nr:RNA-binding signal recognition particle subunit srp14 [Polyrhizophydium stewartii]